MTKSLNILLQRILPPELKEAKTNQKPSKNLTVLLKRVKLRKWKEATEVSTALQLETLHRDLTFIEHFRNCKLCMAELQISVERYLGTRGPWYLNIENEVGFPEIYEDEDSIYKDCPRPQDYTIGSYWTGSSEDTVRFIMDRFTWAEGMMKKEIKAADVFLSALKDWDLRSPLPPNSSLFWGC